MLPSLGIKEYKNQSCKDLVKKKEKRGKYGHVTNWTCDQLELWSRRGGGVRGGREGEFRMNADIVST